MNSQLFTELTQNEEVSLSGGNPRPPQPPRIVVGVVGAGGGAATGGSASNTGTASQNGGASGGTGIYIVL